MEEAAKDAVVAGHAEAEPAAGGVNGGPLAKPVASMSSREQLIDESAVSAAAAAATATENGSAEVSGLAGTSLTTNTSTPPAEPNESLAQARTGASTVCKDCGCCEACKDMIKFGGPGKLHRRCRQKSVGPDKGQPRPPTAAVESETAVGDEKPQGARLVNCLGLSPDVATATVGEPQRVVESSTDRAKERSSRSRSAAAAAAVNAAATARTTAVTASAAADAPEASVAG